MQKVEKTIIILAISWRKRVNVTDERPNKKIKIIGLKLIKMTMKWKAIVSNKSVERKQKQKKEED